MNIDEFKKYIESIGFKLISTGRYKYDSNIIILLDECYQLHNSFEWIVELNYDDLKPFEKYFKKELRTIKLKKILR